MNLKKALAVLLTVATVLTSQSFTGVVYAAEEPVASTQSDDSEVSDPEEADDEETDEGQESDSEEEDDQNEDDQKGDDDQSTPEEDVVTDDETVTDLATDDETLTDEENVDEELLEEELPEEELLTEEVEDLDDKELESADDYFERTETLKRKSGKPLASTVTIPKEVKTIPVGIFNGNSTVKEIKFEDGSVLDTIDEGAFRNSAITKITIPASYTGKGINPNTFRNSKLQSITFKGTITSIGENAFSGTNLKEISANSCTSVADSAFQGCQYLSRVYMNSLTAIGEGAFDGCTSLNSGMNFSSTIRSIGVNAFRNCGFTSLDLTKLTNIGADLTIGEGALSSNKKLTTVTLDSSSTPTRYTKIPSSLFADCSALTTVNIPGSVTEICGSAFEGCTSLASIYIPASVATIESEAFGGCSKLANVDICYTPASDDDHISIIYDAFPLKSGVKMRGYDTYVRDYAQMMGYTFESLNKEHKITLQSGNVNTTLSKSTARVGDKITVTVKPSGNYSFTGISISNSDGSTIAADDQPTLDEIGSNAFTYSFVMPDNDVILKISSESNSSLSSGTVTYDFVNDAPYYHFDNSDNNVYTYNKRGLSSKLRLFVNGKQYDNSLFTFSSSNSNIITVDGYGVITGVQTGNATITVTPRYNSGKKFSLYMKVSSSGNVDIAKMSIAAATASNSDCVLEQGTDTITGYPYITFDKKALQTTNQQLTVKVNAYGWKSDRSKGYDSSVSYFVKSDWTVSDSSIASLASSSRTTNSNVITVKKGATGETLVAVSTKNTGESKANGFNDTRTEKEDNIAYLIIRVIDTTPRLGETVFNINNQLKDGVSMTIVPVYGYEINDDVGLKVCYKTTTNGVTSYSTECDDLVAKYESGDGWYLQTTDALDNSLDFNKTKSYSANKLYLVGQYKAASNHASNGYFYIPLPAINITNTRPNPSITQSGKINMFYNSTADKADVGEVTLTQSLNKLTVTGYEFVSSANYAPSKTYEDSGYKKEGDTAKDSETKLNGTDEWHMLDRSGNIVPFDSFGYNFDIVMDGTNSNKATVTRSSVHTNVAKVNKKTVVSGYLYITYAEYKSPAIVAITISNQETAPSYVLSQTSVTANTKSANQEYNLYLYPKGKSNLYANAVDLKKTYTTKDDGTLDNCYVTFDAGATTGNFDVSNMRNITDEKSLKNKYLKLKVPSGKTAKAGKTVIGIHMTTWSETDKKLFYTFTVSTTSNDATASLDKKTVTVNRAFVNTDKTKDVQTIEVKPSTSDVSVTGLYDKQTGGTVDTVTYKTTSNTTTNARYDIVKSLISASGNTITISQPEAVDKINFTGDFTFMVYPQITYTSGTSKILGALSFTVKIANNVPKMSVANGFSLNTTLSDGMEKPTSSYTLSNMLTDTKLKDYSVITDNAKITKNVSGATPQNYTAFATSIAMFGFTQDTEKNTGTVTAYKEGFAKTNAGTYKLTGVQIKSANGSVATLAEFTVTLSAVESSPSVSLSSSGKINTIDHSNSSAMIYVPTINNVKNGTIAYNETTRNYEIKILEVDPTTKEFLDPAKMHFGWDYDKYNNKLYVYIDQNASEIVPNKTYEIYLKFGIGQMSGSSGSYGTLLDGDIVSSKLTITPVESFPSVSATPKRNYVYAGQDRTDTTSWYVEVPVKLSQQYITTNTVVVTETYIPNDDGTYNTTPDTQVVKTTSATNQTATLGTTITTTYDANNVKTVVTKNVWYSANATINNICWASSATTAIKNTFEIGQVDSDGNFHKNTFSIEPMETSGEDTGLLTIAIKLKDASQQVQNKQYTLNLMAQYENQTVDSDAEKAKIPKGSAFSINLNIKK